MKKFLKKAVLALSVMAMVFTVACGKTEAPAKDDTANSASSDVFRVGMECGYAPYNWAQSDDSNGAVPIEGSKDFAYGYDVIMAKKIAESMGKTLQIHKIDWDGLPLALQSGTIDAVIAGQSITAKRLQTVDFSKPYYYASVVAVTKNDSAYKDATKLADLKGSTVTSQINTIWYDVCLPQIAEANILPAQESAPQMLVALESKKADVIVCDMPTALAATAVYPDFKILDLSASGDDFKVSDEDVNIGISVKKGNTELVNQINDVLSTMTKDDYTKIMNDAIAVQPLNK